MKEHDQFTKQIETIIQNRIVRMINSIEDPVKLGDLKKIAPIIDFIQDCNVECAALILHEILTNHQILTWNVADKTLTSVDSVCVNGMSIQMNLVEYEGDIPNVSRM